MRPLLLSTLVLLATFAGCLGQAPQDDDRTIDPLEGRTAPEDWIGGLRNATFAGATNSLHYLTADDGTQLSLTLHLPADLSADARIPTLVQLTPYQVSSGTQGSAYQEYDSNAGRTWSYFIERGAAYVEADARGTNGSEGCLDFGGSKDRSDAKVFNDWIRAQPWSNGVVVLDGVSHPGMGSVVAHAADPLLTGALAHAPVVSYYADQWYQGAFYDTQVNGIYQVIETTPGLLADPQYLAAQPATCTGETFLQYENPQGPFTELWADRHLARHIDPAVLEANTPIVLTQGFIDLNVFPDHPQWYWDALPEDHAKYLIMGYWYHGFPDMTGHYSDAVRGPYALSAEQSPYTFQHLRQRWLEHLLFGDDNGVRDDPRVLIEDSQGTWHESHDWPLDGATVATWYPDATDGTFTRDLPASDGSSSYTDRENTMRGRWTDSHVAFRSEPLGNDTLVHGMPVVNLTASSDQAETKWVVYLLDEAPDGTWDRITHGYADSHSWGDEADWLDMEPGSTYVWSIHMLPTAFVVEAGHRITLLVASQDMVVGEGGRTVCWPDHRDPDDPDAGCYAPAGIVPSATAGRAVNSVYTGPLATSVTMATIDPGLTQKVPWAG